MNRCRSDKAAIEAILPHRDPFLLLDEVIELESRRHAWSPVSS